MAHALLLRLRLARLPLRCGALGRALAAAVLLLATLTGAAQAATYGFRSDTFAWETAANAVTWDRLCTDYPGDDDKATLNFTGGFTFRFAGTAYSSVRVLTNGMLQFGTDTGFHRTFTNTTLPAGSAGNRSGCASSATTLMLMPYWTDLDPSRAGSGNVTWELKGSAPNRYVVVSWNSVYQYGTSTPYAFQVILYESGEFKYQYGNSNATGSAATIGVQVSSSDYTLYSFNSGYNANGSAIRWFIPSTAAGRVAEYRFDEWSWNGSVGEVLDSSGNSQHGVRVGSASPTASGVVCRRLEVPANTSTTISAVDTALDVDSAVGDAGTLSFWVRSNNAWNSGTAAMLASATTVANRPFFLQRNASGALQFTVSDSSGSTISATTPALTYAAGTWVHVAATWSLRTGASQSTLRVYVNGVQQAVGNAKVNGDLDPSLGTLYIGDNRSSATPTGATVNSANGQIDEFFVYNYEATAAEIALDMARTHDCAPPLHHLELRHASGQGLTCQADTLTIVACQDSSCSSTYTGGVTGTLSSGHASMLWPAGSAFTIAAGSSSGTLALQLPVAGTSTLGVASSSPAATATASCNFGSPSCTWTAADSGLLLSVADHVAETSQTLRVQAVKKADHSAACTTAFGGVTRSIAFSCSHADPSSGARPVRIGSRALNAANSSSAACDGSSAALSLAFDATGSASATLLYADAGQVNLAASYTGSAANGDSGLVMSGSTRFTAVPASLAVGNVSAAPIRAGSAFSATVTALNSAGAATPSFGRESTPAVVTLAFSRTAPTGTGASDGVFTGSLGSFSGGSASATNLVWSEVGSGSLRASLSGGNYLGSGLAPSAGSAAVGRFVPHHFDVVATPACGAFSYSGQPFSVTVTARNGLASPTTTVNYDGSAATTPNSAQTVTLSDTSGASGSWNGTQTVAAARFAAGTASVTTPAFTFTDKLTAARSLLLRATDADGVSSAGAAEPAMPLRSGRLRLFNGFGGAGALALAAQTQYWSGSAWVLNSADSCTVVAAGAVALVQTLDPKGQAAASWSPSFGALTFAGGHATLGISAPPAGRLGSLDLALNLGSSGSDQSCLASHPASSGAAAPWLRSRQGSCSSAWDRDPSARASFGITAAETRKTVFVQELY